MKKITELSKFAIRMHEIYNYLTQPHVDFFRISDKFKEHSQYLIKDLSSLLESVSPQIFKTSLAKMYPSRAEEIKVSEDTIIDLSKRKTDTEIFETSETEIIKGEMIMEDDDEIFHDYEAQIMKPVKPLDIFLQKLDSGELDRYALKEFVEIMEKNGELSAKQGFDIIAGMHKIIAESLSLINSGTLKTEKHCIESIRACLIVIVAVVKGKEIDITNYLNRAEEFGREIQGLK
jgi:hypothetical protein